MRTFYWLLILPFLLCFSGVFAQKSTVYTHDLQRFDTAMDLYTNKQYASAQLVFEKVQQNASNEDIKGDCAYYIANCAIRTNANNAEDLVALFVKKYPTSS